MKQKRFFLPILLFFMLFLVTPAPLHAYSLQPAGLISTSIPAPAAPLIPLSQADLTNDGILETLDLENGRLSILSNGQITWQSPAQWQVMQAIFSDLNHDGQTEVTLLLWRPFKPWLVDHWLPNGGRIAGFQDKEGFSCHIILIGWTRAGYHELWAGSPMADPINSMAAADLDGDGAQELVALEGRYADGRSAPARTLKVWEWNGFGFTVVSYNDGWFLGMTLVCSNNGMILIVTP
jgi:hypothetical protein